MFFEQISTPGLGCFSFVIGCPATGTMAVVDPRRDIEIYLSIAQKNGMQITGIFDTHVHADHISGAQALSRITSADIYIHESASISYQAKKLKNGDEFTFGKAHLRVLHTPGHTPDSVSFLVADLARTTEPEMILTGDLLFVGDIGRPDLPGKEILDEQVQNLYNSLYKTLGALPDYLEVYPSHGQGSLCGSGMSGKPHSTLGYERLANRMLRHYDYESFKSAILAKTPMRPQSFSAIINANRNIVNSVPTRNIADFALSANRVEELQKEGALLLDLRDAFAYGNAHIKDSINVDFFDGVKLNWVGVAVPAHVPLVLILSADDDFQKICAELQRIGYDEIKGWLKDGIHAWINSGRDTQHTPYISATHLKARLATPNQPIMLDVRSGEEFNRAKIEGAINYTFEDILAQKTCPMNEDKDIVVICQSGFRAGIAASMLKKQGYDNISILAGGMLGFLA